jgi:restriction endonuclease Mrr
MAVPGFQDFNLGVSTETSYEIKRVDSDFFAEE